MSPQCSGKVRHTSKGDAMRAIRSIEARRTARSNRSGMRVGAYRCTECDGFHIGASRR